MALRLGDIQSILLQVHKFYVQSIIININLSGLSQATTFYNVILIVFATLGTPVLLTANR